ncbi:MAG: hypothetical protein EA396_07635 [Anaerolineaceae bacterium]|nr:MAG: hypothetical protein EA396_07635 [Anaerolineaceae bacterium]
MAVLMAVTLFLPGLAPPQTVIQEEAPPTTTPVPPTFPPPISNLDAITIGEQYLHPSGVFVADVPSGWSIETTINDTRRAQVNMSNPDAVSRIQVGFEVPIGDITSVADLNAHFDENRMQQIWAAEYASWSELGRPSTEDRLIINYRLRDRQQRNFLAQHVARIDGELIHFSRVVMPDNAQESMFYLSDIMQDSVNVIDAFAAGPFGWNASYDREHQWLLRYPRSWTRTDGGDGLPTSFRADDGAAIRVDVTPNTSVNESAARDLVEARFGEVVSVQAIERTGGNGFSISYSARDFDGEAVSGLVILLNGDTGSLYIASARIAQGDVDLNEDGAGFNTLRDVLNSFSVITGFDLPRPEPAPTPTPFPGAEVEAPADDDEADGDESADEVEEADDEEAEADDDEADENGADDDE